MRWRRPESLHNSSLDFASRGFIKTRRARPPRCAALGLSTSKHLLSQRQPFWRTREQYIEFARNIILREHLQRLPSEDLRDLFMAELAEQAAADDPSVLIGLLATEFARKKLEQRTSGAKAHVLCGL